MTVADPRKARILKYHGNDQPPGDGNTLVMTRDGVGDFLIGVQHVDGGINHGTHYVRFRRANGGASNHPSLIRALAELESALAEIAHNDRTVGPNASGKGRER